MRMWSILGALMLCAAPAMPVQAEDVALEERIKKLEQALEELKKEQKREREIRISPPISPPGEEPGIGTFPEVAKEKRTETQAPLSVGSLGSGKLVYTRPFVSSPKATVGGYTDIQFASLSRANLDLKRANISNRQTFSNLRMVPFIYADVTDRIKFATEIEFERGGPNNNQSDGEVKLEFAQIDYLIKEWLNFRGGILLAPIGKFNLLHDSPLNDLADRPMVARLIIPSTFSETGVGFFGTLYPTRLSKLDYEIYVVNGFQGVNGSNNPINLSDTSGLRSIRGSEARDPNDNKSLMGRVAFSPILGVEVAGSIHYGTWLKDEAGTHNLGLYALDWTLQRGPFEVIGEAAWARIEGNQTGNRTPANRRGPTGMFGYYIQGNYHFMPPFLKKWAPAHFTDASTFTAVIRWEEVDTDTTDITRRIDPLNGNARELQRLTLGLNFRPIEDTVFKFDWQFNSQLNTASTNRVDGNGFLFQAATYF